jgi:hypothetical protein
MWCLTWGSHAYISTLHYLRAKAQVGSDDAEAVNRAMRDPQLRRPMLSNPRILSNAAW